MSPLNIQLFFFFFEKFLILQKYFCSFLAFCISFALLDNITKEILITLHHLKCSHTLSIFFNWWNAFLNWFYEMICRRTKTKIENCLRQTARLKNTVLGNRLLFLNSLFYNYRKKEKRKILFWQSKNCF